MRRRCRCGECSDYLDCLDPAGAASAYITLPDGWSPIPYPGQPPNVATQCYGFVPSTIPGNYVLSRVYGYGSVARFTYAGTAVGWATCYGMFGVPCGVHLRIDLNIMCGTGGQGSRVMCYATGTVALYTDPGNLLQSWSYQALNAGAAATAWTLDFTGYSEGGDLWGRVPYYPDHPAQIAFTLASP